jgi:hypothetical protein
MVLDVGHGRTLPGDTLILRGALRAHLRMRKK